MEPELQRMLSEEHDKSMFDEHLGLSTNEAKGIEGADKTPDEEEESNTEKEDFQSKFLEFSKKQSSEEEDTDTASIEMPSDSASPRISDDSMKGSDEKQRDSEEKEMATQAQEANTSVKEEESSQAVAESKNEDKKVLPVETKVPALTAADDKPEKSDSLVEKDTTSEQRKQEVVQETVSETLKVSVEPASCESNDPSNDAPRQLPDEEKQAEMSTPDKDEELKETLTPHDELKFEAHNTEIPPETSNPDETENDKISQKREESRLQPSENNQELKKDVLNENKEEVNSEKKEEITENDVSQVKSMVESSKPLEHSEESRLGAQQATVEESSESEKQSSSDLKDDSVEYQIPQLDGAFDDSDDETDKSKTEQLSKPEDSASVNKDQSTCSDGQHCGTDDKNGNQSQNGETTPAGSSGPVHSHSAPGGPSSTSVHQQISVPPQAAPHTPHQSPQVHTPLQSPAAPGNSSQPGTPNISSPASIPASPRMHNVRAPSPFTYASQASPRHPIGSPHPSISPHTHSRSGTPQSSPRGQLTPGLHGNAPGTPTGMTPMASSSQTFHLPNQQIGPPPGMQVNESWLIIQKIVKHVVHMTVC